MSSNRPPARGPAQVVAGVVVATAAVVTASHPLLSSQDSWWLWDIGRRIVRNGLPTSDPYGFAATDVHWRLQQWLSSAIFGALDALGGLWLVTVVLALTIGLAYALAARLILERAPGFTGAMLVGAAMVAGSVGWSLRGALATLVLTPVLIAELQRGPRPTRVGLLMVLWVNLHGSALIGAGLIVVHAAGCVLRRRLGAGDPADWRPVAAALAGLVVTPYGPLLLWSDLRMANLARQSPIFEWQPPHLLGPSSIVFTILAVVCLTALAVEARPEDLPDALVALAMVILAASAIRNVPWAALGIPITCGPAVYRVSARLRRRVPWQGASPAVRRLERILTAAVALLGLVAVAAVPPRTRDIPAHVSTSIPLDLIETMATRDHEVRLLALDSWSVAAAVVGDGAIRTFYDGRVEIYAGTVMESYLTAYAARPGWDRILDRWCVTDLLVPTTSALFDAAARSETWEVVATEATASGSAAWLDRVGAPAPCPTTG